MHSRAITECMYVHEAIKFIKDKKKSPGNEGPQIVLLCDITADANFIAVHHTCYRHSTAHSYHHWLELRSYLIVH